MISVFKISLLIPCYLAQQNFPFPTAIPSDDCSNEELPQYFVSSSSDNLMPADAEDYCASMNATLVAVDDLAQDQCVFQKLIETDDFASDGHMRGLLVVWLIFIIAI